MFIRAIVDYIDDTLNAVTMYRLVLYGLMTIIAMAFILTVAGLLEFGSVIDMSASLAVLVAVCWGVNTLLARMFRAQTSVEAALITSLILFLILEPSSDPQRLLLYAGVGLVAVAPKYFFGPMRSVFNPAAIALVLFGVLGQTGAIWWVGSEALLPVVAVVGLLVVRKLRRFQMVGLFWLIAVWVLMVTGIASGDSVLRILAEVLTSWPLIFFGAIMLTEPSTTPPTRRWQLVYATLVGVLFSVQFHVGPLYASPELALVAGNLLAYAVSTKKRLIFTWQKTTELAPGLYEFLFKPNVPVAFKAGQYVEWTLSHSGADSRGTRRFFTLASAPQDEQIRLVVRAHAETASSFKKALLGLSDGSVVAAGKVQGDFVLPDDRGTKLGWIAGGIGVTPFMSMASEMTELGQKRDVAMLYTSAKPEEFLYDELWQKASGVDLTKVLTDPKAKSWPGETGFIDANMLARVAPDFKERRWYISGPDAMVTNYRRMLRSAGVPGDQVVTDYFSGY